MSMISNNQLYCFILLPFKVILAGAATKMCRLQNLIKEKFPDQTQILNQLSPDEVIALGCAKQSYILTNSKYKKFNQGDNQFQCLADEVVLKVRVKIKIKWSFRRTKLFKL